MAGRVSRAAAQSLRSPDLDGMGKPRGGAGVAGRNRRTVRRARVRRRGRGPGCAGAGPAARARTGLERDRRELRGQRLATVTVSIATGDVAMLYGLPELGIAAIASTALIPEVTLPMIW